MFNTEATQRVPHSLRHIRPRMFTDQLPKIYQKLFYSVQVLRQYLKLEIKAIQTYQVSQLSLCNAPLLP